MDRESPTPDEVRAQLDRLLASETFATASRLRRFLRHVVERSLAGEADKLKEYAIGVDVFDRDPDYDPRIDSIVRVEAGRLRAKLDEHDNGPGAADPVRIRMPRGGYAPIFERRQRDAVATADPIAAPTAAAPDAAPVTADRRPALAVTALVVCALVGSAAAWWTRAGERASGGVRPLTIAVLPFASFSTDPADRLLAARLTDGVTSELTRLGTLGVVSRTTARQLADERRGIRDIARTLNVDFVVEASVETDGDQVHVDARVVDAAVDLKSGGRRIDGRRDDLAALQRDVAAAITAAARARSSAPRS